MSKQWYYQDSGTDAGPVSSFQLQELVRSGSLSDTVRVRETSSQPWTRYSRVKDTVARDAAAHPQAVAVATETMAAGSDAAATTDTAPLEFTSIDAIPLDDGSSNAPTRNTVSAEDEHLFYCQSFGEVLGPMSQREIVKLAGSGILTPEDQVRKTADGEWLPAIEFAELAGALQARRALHGDLAGGDEDPGYFTELPEVPEQQVERADDQRGPHKTQHREEAKSAKPAGKRKPRRKRGGAMERELRRLRAENARLRRSDSDDPRMQEIFSDVFGGEDDSADERPESPHPGTARSTPAAASSAPASNAATVSPAAVSGTAAMPAAASIPSAPPAAPKFTPPPRPVKSRGSSSGGALKMPAMIAAGVLLIGLCGWGLTQVSFGGIFGIDVEKVLTDYRIQYDKLAQGSPSPSDWNAFAESARADAKTAIDQLRSDGAPVGRDLELYTAATRLVQLVNAKADDEEKRKQFYEEFTAALGS